MYKEDIMDKVALIITGIMVILINALFIIILLIKKHKKKNLLLNLDRLTTEKNQIISSSLITELGKANKLVNNKKK